MQHVSLHDTIDKPLDTTVHTGVLECTPPYNMDFTILHIDSAMEYTFETTFLFVGYYAWLFFQVYIVGMDFVIYTSTNFNVNQTR